MQLTVFGANGKVGQLVVNEILSNGHKVTAFIHGENPFEIDSNLVVVSGDIYNTESVENALVGSDVVISTLGSWGTPKKDILTTGMKNIIPAMKKLGIVRIVSLTGAGCNPKSAKPRLIEKINRLPLQIFAPKVLRDSETHMQQLTDSGLSWTILRSPVMNNRRNDRDYSINSACPKPWETINRHSVAKAIVELIIYNNFIKQSPFVSRK